MRFLLCVLALLFATASASAKQRVHVVSSGHTLGKIAKRYRVTIAALCKANGISRRSVLKVGQKLLIPDKDGKVSRSRASKQKQETRKSVTRPKTGPGGMKTIEVPGAGNAYYYEPIGPGRKSLRPVLMYLHGRGGNPRNDCRRWVRVARRLGWLVCPSGPGARGDGRGWNNNWAQGQQVALATVRALRKRYGRRVQLYGNTLIGFSEGAYVALNVGVRNPRTFNRWLILAGKTHYFGGPGLDELKRNRRRLRRIYLITGEDDGVIDGTKDLRARLRKAGVSTRISTPAGIGHQVALESKPAMYRAALVWLERGITRPRKARRHAKRN